MLVNFHCWFFFLTGPDSIHIHFQQQHSASVVCWGPESCRTASSGAGKKCCHAMVLLGSTYIKGWTPIWMHFNCTVCCKRGSRRRSMGRGSWAPEEDGIVPYYLPIALHRSNYASDELAVSAAPGLRLGYFLIAHPDPGHKKRTHRPAFRCFIRIDFREG